MKQPFSGRAQWPGAIVLVMGLGLGLVAQATPPIVQPGAPGQPSRQISAEQALDLARVRYSAADVRFMSDMIPHHQQALDMAELVVERTARNELIELARRIESSQKDEIEFMLGWLRDRDEPLPDRDWRAHVMPVDAGEHEGHGHHHHPGHHTMEGMATVEQMEALEAASGDAFDRQFLSLMIEHHRGALVMVDELLAQAGSGQDPVLFEFVTDVKNDQTTEIDRMTVMLAGFSPDPRVGLAAGLHDAGEAIFNMQLLAALPRPTGFYDPDNPAGLSDKRLRALAASQDLDDQASDQEEGDARNRGPLLDFANTDMAFAGDLLVAGNYHGFNLYDISNDGLPELLSSIVCPGGQGDVSVVGDLLILSVEQFRGRLDCGLMGVAETVSDERFRGLRIFDISDRTAPVQVGAVQTCRGSHTHTVVAGPEPDGRIIVYNSGTAPVREEEEMPGCIDESPWRDDQTALFRIDVIEIPVDRPEDARIIHSPAVFVDPETGVLAGLWERGDHGPGTQTSNETNHCHDITVFPALNLAAGACSGNGILFDISDPINPTRIDDVTDPGFAYWHSATFNNDGSKVIFTDEWGGGTRPRCRASDPMHWGANAIYDIIDNRLVFRSYYKMPAPQTEQENCVAHNGSLLPVPGRDIMVQAWYQGGISVFDFTDTANPIEIAYFDRGPIDEEELITGGYWSSYWYRGLVYGTEIVRGLDVLALTPSAFLSENEIAAASLKLDDDLFNPQTQLVVDWPAHPVVARAYLDQLDRGLHVDENQRDLIEELLARFEQAGGAADSALAGALSAQSSRLIELGQARTGTTRQRLLALGDVLRRLSEA
jgi:uncharacterized protein (DUF305 family)